MRKSRILWALTGFLLVSAGLRIGAPFTMLTELTTPPDPPAETAHEKARPGMAEAGSIARRTVPQP